MGFGPICNDWNLIQFYYLRKTFKLLKFCPSEAALLYVLMILACTECINYLNIYHFIGNSNALWLGEL